jgi:iron-sulfur cluster assembly accessory protein
MVLHGIVKGEVSASRRVELGPTARVIGDVYFDLIQMAAGAEIDYKEDLQGAQFIIRNPNAQATCGCGQSFTV